MFALVHPAAALPRARRTGELSVLSALVMFSGTDAILIPPRVRDGEPDVATVAIGEGAPGVLLSLIHISEPTR